MRGPSRWAQGLPPRCTFRLRSSFCRERLSERDIYEPYGKRVIRAPDNPRMRVLVDDEAEQVIIAQLQAWAGAGMGISEMARRLNTAGSAPPQGARWTKHTIYNLRLRLSQIQRRVVNVRPHSDEDVKEQILELRSRGHTHVQVASILSELGFLPLKGRRFTECSVRKQFGRCRRSHVLSPRRFLEAMLDRMQREHEAEGNDEPFALALQRLSEPHTERGWAAETSPPRTPFSMWATSSVMGRRSS